MSERGALPAFNAGIALGAEGQSAKIRTRILAFNRILDILAELEPGERAPVLEAVRVALEVMK